MTSRSVVMASFGDVDSGARHVVRMQLCDLALHCSNAYDFDGIAMMLIGMANLLSTSRREWSC
jgi:hypothetical protein